MFGFRYLKSTPTQYVIYHKNGKVRRAGAGLSFFYFQPSASIELLDSLLQPKGEGAR